MPPAVYRVSPDVVFRDLDGEAVILNLASGTYFGLNVVASRMWQLIDEGRPPGAIVEAVAAEFDVDRDTVRADFEDLIAGLIERGLVTVAAGEGRP